MSLSQRFIICLTLVSLLHAVASADPQPGDVFREYTFTNTYGDAGGAIRVGGKRGESHPDRGSDFGYVNAWIEFPHQIDLEHAIRAEVIVEKILSHNGTTGLAMQWNDGSWIDVPAPVAIPEPRADYYHHACLTVDLPLEVVKPSPTTNQFRLRVAPDHPWNWPQHLIYGVHLRVYYDADRKQHVRGKITSIQSGDTLDRRINLETELENPIRRVNRVDYLGLYEGVNWEGDGVYRRWHYFYYHGQLLHHLASASSPPYLGCWDTTWTPDQVEPISICARITDDSGLTLMSETVDNLRLARNDYSVELCKPKKVPANWVSRRNAFTQEVQVEGDLENATAARLVWSSWSPGYMNGIYVNDQLVLQQQGPRYRYYDHRVDIHDLDILQSGMNTIRTGKTPLYEGKMVHGMEVNWPGIQMLIRYRK